MQAPYSASAVAQDVQAHTLAVPTTPTRHILYIKFQGRRQTSLRIRCATELLARCSKVSRKACAYERRVRSQFLAMPHNADKLSTILCNFNFICLADRVNVMVKPPGCFGQGGH